MARLLPLAVYLSLVLSPRAHAGQLFCQGNPRATAVELSWTEAEIQARVVSPMGYDYLPQLEGPLPLALAGFLKMQGSDLAPLGADFTVAWKRAGCEFREEDPWVFHCGPGEITAPRGSVVSSVGLSTSVISERSAYGEQQRWRLRFVFGRGNTYFLTAEFPCGPKGSRASR